MMNILCLTSLIYTSMYLLSKSHVMGEGGGGFVVGSRDWFGNDLGLAGGSVPPSTTLVLLVSKERGFQ